MGARAVCTFLGVYEPEPTDISLAIDASKTNMDIIRDAVTGVLVAASAIPGAIDAVHEKIHEVRNIPGANWPLVDILRCLQGIRAESEKLSDAMLDLDAEKLS